MSRKLLGTGKILVGPCPSPFAVAAGLVLIGASDTELQELLPILVEPLDARMLKKFEIGGALLDLRDWCWTNLPVPPSPFPGR